MKDRAGWRWNIFLLLLAGSVSCAVAQSSYEGARGDSGDNSPASLGFSGVVQRHDGYVKGETPTIPQTSFSCSAQPYNPGLYADVETQCQVYHVCFEDRQESFLCGPGTNFNQRILACDFWYNFNCQDSPSFYSVNADIGKVPDSSFTSNQGRVPQQPQRPSYPSYPQPVQPPSGGSYPPQVSVPPPPPPPRVQPQRPVIVPEDPKPPRVQPQPPRVQPHRPQQPPPVYPEPPRVQPQPPRVHPEQPPYRPQPRPGGPQVSVAVKPQYPGEPQGSGHQTKVHPSTQQEEDNGYQFDGYNPPKPVSLPPPQPPRHQTPRPVFPPVVSPPRISRPPLTPSIIRQPEISRPRVPVIDTRNEYHPDANIKGTTDYRPPQPARIPEPSRPVGIGYPSYPVPQRPISSQRPIPQRPAEKPNRPVYQPPTIQQEHVDTEYVPPPPPPPRPKEPSRPTGTYVPPPPPPVQHEVPIAAKQPSRPAYVPPPVHQRPIERPQPPVSPSIIREQPAFPPPSRPEGSVGVRQPQPPTRPKPVFPPVSDHPNSNIKGGPGYNQPPPQIPRFEPTRISRPSTPQGGYQVPPQVSPPRSVSSGSAVKPSTGKRPTTSGQGEYKPPQQVKTKKPSEPTRTVYQPPIPVIDHPQAEIKGTGYEQPPPQQQHRQQQPSTVSRIKRPQTTVNNQRPQVQRPRAPIIVARPHPPSLPTTTVKKTSPIDSEIYEKPQSVPRVKLPSQTHEQTFRPSQPPFPTYEEIDHPNANIKGGSGYIQPQIQPQRPLRPAVGPSTSYEQRTTSTRCRGPGAGCPPRGDHGSVQQVQDYKPSRSSPPSSIKTVSKISQGSVAVKDATAYPKPPAASQHSVLINKQSKPDYEAGSSYTRGPEVYPKPEFGQPSAPYQPISIPSRPSQTVKQGPTSQNSITQIQVKPDYRGSSVSAGSGSHTRPEYPFIQVPGHQPPHQRQVFPHRENPDHPNESIKGSSAYRPPPPAGYQAAASEVQEQVAVPEPEPSSSLHGDTGSE